MISVLQQVYHMNVLIAISIFVQCVVIGHQIENVIIIVLESQETSHCVFSFFVIVNLCCRQNVVLI